MQFTREQVESAVVSKDYKWFENGNYNLNIVGIRNSSTSEEVTNKFDDLLTVSYKIDNFWYYQQYGCTTDPGKYYTENLLNPDGVAILVPGQYRSTYSIGLHQGKYEALKQMKPVQVYRDDSKDNCYDMQPDNIQEGIFGINIHRASATGTSTQIDKWSAGCQVIANYEDFDSLMWLARQAEGIWGNSFTYTLIDSQDIV
tara:strand:+ start:262 stop:861 length:600 start_codon:yes stop_codon:yes gene_type:complete